MRAYHFRWSKWLRLFLALCGCIAILIEVCRPITSRDISGVYIRSSQGVVDTIILATNGSFQQTITYKNEGPWTKNGSWIFDYDVVRFDTFYSAFNFDSVKPEVLITIPPEPFSMEVLSVEKGKLIKNSIFPIWFKQPTK